MKELYLNGLYCWWNEVPLHGDTPTIAVHGGCADSRIWKDFGAQFSLRHKPFFAVNLPGHGKNSAVAGMRIQDYVLAMRYFIKGEGNFRSYNLLGHSMGSRVCQELGDMLQVQRMALIGTLPAGVPLLNLSLGFRALRYLPSFLFGWPWKYTWEDFLKLYGNGLDKKIARRLFEASGKESGWAALQMLLGQPRGVPKIHGAIGIFAAHADRVVPPALQHRMVEMYKDLTREVEMFSLTGGHLSIFGSGQEANILRIIDWLYPASG